MGAESILYHARMRVLQSRQGSRRSNGPSRRGAAASPGVMPLHVVRQPCAKEKIVPPKEVLPRDRAFRYKYLQHHQPKGIKRMPSLKRPPDPAREEIVRFARIRAAQKEQEGIAKSKAKANAEASVTAATPTTTAASKTAISKKPPRLPRASGVQMNSPTSVMTLPPLMGSGLLQPSSMSQRSTCEDFSSEEEEGGSFAFLSEWSSLSSSSSSPVVAKRQLPALR
jgi:hypothetical protein